VAIAGEIPLGYRRHWPFGCGWASRGSGSCNGLIAVGGLVVVLPCFAIYAGSVNQVAAAFNVSRTTLYRHLAEHNEEQTTP